MAKLYDYLIKIEQGELINYPQMVKKLSKDQQHDVAQIFRPEKRAANSYAVTIVDPDAFAQLLQSASASITTRLEAAQQGFSHKVCTSYSYLLVYHDQLPSAAPAVVLIDDQQLNQDFVAKKQLLIIENEENFFAYQQMLPLLAGFFDAPLDLSNTDVVFGAGNQINKGLNFCFFEQYHSVLCAFDYDLGGLLMFKTLQQRLGDQVIFLMPDNFGPWLADFNYPPENSQKWLAAIQLAEALGFSGLAAAFRQQRMFMEQEVLLTINGSILS